MIIVCIDDVSLCDIYAHVFLFMGYLQVKLTLDEPEPGLTVVKLTHTDVPEEDRLVLEQVCYYFALKSRV